MTRFNGLRTLGRDCRGGAAVEMAIALPLLATSVFGIFQMSVVYTANAGVQHALGEGARMATLFVPDGAGGGTSPTASQIISKITAKKFGPQNGTWVNPSVTTDTTNNTMTITLTYNQPTDLLFAPGPTVAITKSKTVHLSNSASGTIS